MAGGAKERSMQETPTWAIAVVCFILLVVSIIIEHLIHLLDKWLKKKHKHALSEALEKIKAELMLLGFISLILTVMQYYIAEICIPKSAGLSWHPCRKDQELDIKEYYDSCADDKTQLVSAKALHELHIFIFVLAAFHVLFSITTLGLGTLKMRKWKAWEDETKTLEYQYYNDPERFRYARETSFGRRHLHFWSEYPILLWIVCFFRQFLASITKADYLVLRHGFVVAHLAPNNDATFDFQKYISRSLEKDFKFVVEISPTIWPFAVLFLLSNTHGWHSYFWLPIIPLLITLLVGAKLQVIITQMGLRIQERGDIIKGTPVVETGDHLFWFNRPRFLLFLINFILFQNAFQLAFFAFSTYKYGLPSCFHKGAADIAIRLSMGIIVQFICSYVTLPLYALVTQMGSTMKPEIFDDKVSSALRSWHHTAKKNVKEGRKSENTTPFSSRPGTPWHETSPLHLLQGYKNSTNDDSLATPRASNSDNEMWANEVYPSSQHNIDDDDDPTGRGKKDQIDYTGQVTLQVQPSTSRITTRQRSRSAHEIDINSTDFSFKDTK